MSQEKNNLCPPWTNTTTTSQPRKGNKNNYNSRQGCDDKKKKIVSISKALSWVLRHGAPSCGMAMSSDGYVPVNVILNSRNHRFASLQKKYDWSLQDIQEVVETNEKQRFRLSTRHIQVSRNDNNNNSNLQYRFVKGVMDETSVSNGYVIREVLCIRANQGHSIPNICCDEKSLKLLTSSELEQMNTLVHGTYYEAWENIKKSGFLSRMKRNHIHLATGLPSSSHVISGMRKSSQIYIYINTKKCATENTIPFYQSDNGVILTPGIDDGKLPIDYFLKVIDAKTGSQIL